MKTTPKAGAFLAMIGDYSWDLREELRLRAERVARRRGARQLGYNHIKAALAEPWQRSIREEQHA